MPDIQPGATEQAGQPIEDAAVQQEAAQAKLQDDCIAWHPEGKDSKDPQAQAWFRHRDNDPQINAPLGPEQSLTVTARDYSLSDVARRTLLRNDKDFEKLSKKEAKPKIDDMVHQIVEANKDEYPSLVCNPGLIKQGWVLRIPGPVQETPPQEAPATPAQVAHPATPPQVAHPATPAQVAHPATPAQVAHPAAPAQVAHPATPAQVAHPAAPAQREQTRIAEHPEAGVQPAEVKAKSAITLGDEWWAAFATRDKEDKFSEAQSTKLNDDLEVAARTAYVNYGEAGLIKLQKDIAASIVKTHREESPNGHRGQFVDKALNAGVFIFPAFGMADDGKKIEIHNVEIINGGVLKALSQAEQDHIISHPILQTVDGQIPYNEADLYRDLSPVRSFETPEYTEGHRWYNEFHGWLGGVPPTDVPPSMETAPHPEQSHPDPPQQEIPPTIGY